MLGDRFGFSNKRVLVLQASIFVLCEASKTIHISKSQHNQLIEISLPSYSFLFMLKRRFNVVEHRLLQMIFFFETLAKSKSGPSFRRRVICTICLIRRASRIAELDLILNLFQMLDTGCGFIFRVMYEHVDKT